MSRPPGNMLATYLAFCLALRSLTAMHRVSAGSWWRTRQRNDAVGGLENSRHLDGLGADLYPDTDTNRAHIIDTARALGLQVVDEGTHIHVEMDP